MDTEYIADTPRATVVLSHKCNCCIDRQQNSIMVDKLTYIIPYLRGWVRDSSSDLFGAEHTDTWITSNMNNSSATTHITIKKEGVLNNFGDICVSTTTSLSSQVNIYHGRFRYDLTESEIDTVIFTALIGIQYLAFSNFARTITTVDF